MTKDLYDKLMVFGNDQEPFLTHNFMRTTDLDDGTATVTLPMHTESLNRWGGADGERQHRLSGRRCRRQHPDHRGQGGPPGRQAGLLFRRDDRRDRQGHRPRPLRHVLHRQGPAPMSRRALCRWCIALAVFFAAYFALRTSRAAMTALWYGAVLPAEQWLGRLCGRLTLSVGEVLILTAVFCAILWLANVPRRIIAARGRRWGMALRLTLTALCTVLTVYAGFCLTWGIGYNTDSFQEKSGIHARPSTAETLAEVTAYFAGNLAACADDVPRDESGVCTLDRQAVLNRSASALDVLCGEFPFLRAETGGAKGFACSRALSALRFTGFYFPFTGEPNVNMDSPAAFLPATVCHELAHQRGVTAEEECNFIGILAATRSEDTGYRYSGWLTGFGYLSNALYSADREAWQTIRDALPDTVVADLRADNAYWAQFRGVVSKVSDTVYDGFLKSNGDTDGSKSYGVVTDLLVAYFG